MERAKIVLLILLSALTVIGILRMESRARSVGTQLDAMHGELRGVNDNLDQIQEAQRGALERISDAERKFLESSR